MISNYIDFLSELNQKREKLLSLLKLDALFYSRKQDIALFEIAKKVLVLPDIPNEIWNCRNVENTLGNIIEISHHGITRDNIREELLKDFDKSILIFEAKSALVNWKNVSGKWFVPRFLGQQKIAKKLKTLSKIGKIRKLEILQLLEKVIHYQKEQKILDDNAEMLSRMLEFLWKNGSSEWEKVIQICEAVINIHKAVLDITNDASKSKLVRSNLSIDFSEGAQTYISINGKYLQSYKESFERIKDVENKLSELLGINFPDNDDPSQDWIAVWSQKALNWRQNLDDLRDWSGWNLSVQKVLNAGLHSVVQAYQQGELNNDEVLSSFKKAIFRHGSEYIISSEPQLSTFNGKLFENKIRKFRDKSRYFEELTKAELFAKLASDIPSFTREAAKSSEIGILQRAIRSKGRGMSLRRLFDLIPNLLPRMCPCMLMSPISVAQYFEIDQTKFDLIVFDEASQMPTSEAVGAIARGKNVIVVGDPKQMPPTSFFSTNNFDEENAEKEDLESILDDCLALSIPSKHLLWHYRSKHESLIAFSNSNYYDNKLMTFPSPDDITTKVSNIHVPGFYDRGKTRQNRFEATAITEEVIRMLADPELSKRSIGIVTFSSAQQNLIEDLLNEAFKQRPDLELIAMESGEPIFIKNLENVQGDERDVILFSMGYGPDKEGNISLNFGPLNREGGWRRLNVAVSRARYEMKVFSTLRSDQIDITRTSSEGVAGIKAFLEYSEKGKKVLSQKNNFLKEKPNSFESHIAEEIRKFGYDVRTNIGCSGYRIDIGVINPENTSEYILGILTDGENYRSAKTAKDRELIRMQVLQLLGWNIYKLWSPDWWDNPRKVIQEIKDAIENATKPVEFVSDSTEHREPAESGIQQKREQFAGLKLQGITQHVIEPNRVYAVYKACPLPTTILNFSDEFFDTRRAQKILNQIQQVIQTEAPISQGLLSKRILTAWGISRLGVRLKEYLDGLYGSLNLRFTRQNGNYFYWNEEQNPETYTTFRVPSNDDQKRSPEDLPKQEIAAGLVEILTNQISLPAEDLVKEAARLFGYARLGGNVEQAMK
ncbi:MAG: DUF3320 domain-containing protein, partial [Mariniphaga sp.]|nr:DUF3320 domain-containing protein [Mariniphaga sp.]